MDKLDAIFEMQFKFGKNFTNFEFLQMPNAQHLKQEKIVEFIGHLTEELYEIRRELPARKHWIKDNTQEPDWEKVKEELTDALHFLITIALLLDMSSNSLFESYLRKNQINIDRRNLGEKND